MKYYRENPDSEANQEATRQNEREVFALKMSHLEQTEHPMKTTHTPGPWHVAADPSPKANNPEAKRFAHFVNRYVATTPNLLDEYGEFVGNIVCTLSDGPEQVQNARLISSAPELLAALDGILPFVEEDYHESCALPVFKRAIEKARAAIAKARGENLP